MALQYCASELVLHFVHSAFDYGALDWYQVCGYRYTLACVFGVGLGGLPCHCPRHQSPVRAHTQHYAACLLSRIVDHRHSPADVLAGFFIGFLFGLGSLVKTLSFAQSAVAMAGHRHYRAPLDGEEVTELISTHFENE